MKSILPLLICSAISAGLGYYFGHITLPASQEASPTTVTSTAPPAPVPQPAPVVAVPPPAVTSPVPVEPVPVVSPEPAIENSPSAAEAAFAQRAALPIQTLTDTQGRTMEATILEVTVNEVKIRRSDGLETKIPLSMLSAEDVAFCNYLREQKSAPKKTSPAIKADEFDWDAYFNS